MEGAAAHACMPGYSFWTEERGSLYRLVVLERRGFVERMRVMMKPWR